MIYTVTQPIARFGLGKGGVMTPQLTEVYQKSADKALNWLMQQLNPDGSYGSAINDLACYYNVFQIFIGQ